ncbi:nucleotidyltransferase domain-containing protein [Candidatus Nitrosacidococcus sp. I8]|uniref:nucleotidyltransferase domain-containing protein n=1 Tax=Candidatus Nitrosacidococcus sp. I8 TaxID=2942908 RepID=UPI002227D0AC|nr:nucleotidyltransferase domain-containing protein [Candidatus Nitrosacidococcus sp. I8]CAH9019648.1 hypothetical protein NURINAE_01667 [Candidatus Nitrosacidococcus sp. I8]
MPLLELSYLQFPKKYLQILQTLLDHYVPQAEVWAYGSRVTGSAHEGSDLDLVLRNPKDLTQNVEGWLDLKEALRESTIPILIDMHNWANLPQDFHCNIEAAYVVVQKGISIDMKENNAKWLEKNS